MSSSSHIPNKADFFLLFALALVSVVVPTYWIIFFTNYDAFSQDAFYLMFEKCFFLIDFGLILASIISIVGHLKRRSWGVLFGIITGVILVTIAMMDTMYRIICTDYSFLLIFTTQSILIEMVINLFCILWGSYLIYCNWRLM
jgi:hypothetical protein